MTTFTSTNFPDGMSRVSPQYWETVAGSDRLDWSYAYLSYREQNEPGRPLALTIDDHSGPTVALHGVVTNDATAVFSHPWKMLTSEQFLRVDEQAPDATAVRAEHRKLIQALQVAGAASDAQDLPHRALSEALGEVLVVRGIDSSEVIARADLDPAARVRDTATLVAGAQDLVRGGLAGAVAFPFVDPENAELRQVLAEHGFRHAALTGVSVYDLSRFGSYDDLLASMKKGRRRLFRFERRALEEAGLRVETVSLADTAERVAELEAANARKYGGAPRYEALLAARRSMAERLGHALRVNAVRKADGPLIACGIHFVDRSTYYVLRYGCDYSVPDRSTAYQCINFYDPLEHALGRRLQWLRMGFEAFETKLLRGARIASREMWLWMPDQHQLQATESLMHLLGDRWDHYSTSLAAQHQPIA